MKFWKIEICYCRILRQRRLGIFIASLLLCTQAMAQLAGYHFRKPIAIDNSIVSGSSDLTNFPILIHISADTDLRTTANGGDVANANGYDIAFSAADGTTRLDHDLEYYDPTTGEYIAWVRIPTLEWDVDTDIYVYYGDYTKTTDQSTTGTWSSGYAGVWHLGEEVTGTGTADLYEDATANGYHGDDGVSATGTDGVIGNGQQFDGSNDYIGMGNVLDYGKNDPMTYSAWVKTTGTGMQIAGKADNGGTETGIWFFMEGSNLSLWICDATDCKYRWSNETFNDGGWHHLVATYDGSNDVSGIQLYGDGALLTTFDSGNPAIGTVTNSFPFSIGSANNSGQFFVGYMDEVRISEAAHSADWIATEYANQNNPTASITVGAPDELVIAPGGVKTDLELWLAADKGPNTSTNGGAVTLWSDISINKFHATGTGTATYQESFANYHGSVDFPGAVESFSDRAMTRTNGTSQTIFVVGEIASVANKTFVEFGDGTNRAYFKDERYKKAGGLGDYSFQSNQPSIWTASDPGSTTPGEVFEDGHYLASSGTRDADWTTGKYLLGYDDTGGDELDGEMAEVIFYDRQLTAAEQQKVESYLAIRYGITLTSDNDGNTTTFEAPNGDGINEGDYIASDGTVLWDASDNSSYHNDVTAVGRDDDTDIDQPKSISANSDAMVIMDKDGEFSNDLDYIFWGNDNASTVLTTVDKHPSYDYRLTREWRVAVNGTPGTVDVQILFAGNNGSAASYSLHVDDDGTFAAGTTDYVGGSIIGDTITFRDVTFSDGNYFTMGTRALTITEGPRGPGGIGDTDGTTDLVLWLDANTIDQASGTEVISWADQSGYGNDANSNAGRGPELQANQLNSEFPLLDWDIAAFDYMRVDDDASLNPDQISVFTVASYTASTGSWAAILQKTNNQGGGTEEGGGWGIAKRSTNQEIRGFVNNRNANSPGGGVNGALTYGAQTIISMVYDQTQNEMFFNETSQGTMAYTSAITDVATFLYLGYDEENGQYLDGTIAETIIIDRPVNDAEQIIISNYLSAKYNLALAAASEAYVEDDNGYDFDVAGIGQASDDSQHADAQGTGILRIFNPTDLGTNEFLIWGHDNGPFDASETTDVPSGVEARLTRKWNVSERTAAGATGPEVGDVDVVFDLDGLGTVVAADLRLIIDTDDDGVFTDETAISDASSVGGSRYAFLGVDLDDSRAFTIGTADQSSTPLISGAGPRGPGGVGHTDGTSNLVVWLDANTISQSDNTEVTQWIDQSGFGNTASAPGGTGPQYRTGQINGYPELQFDVANTEYLGILDDPTIEPSRMSLFVVGNMTASTETWGGFVLKNDGSWTDGYGLARGDQASGNDQQLLGYISDYNTNWVDGSLTYGANAINTLIYDQNNISFHRNENTPVTDNYNGSITTNTEALYIGWTSGYLDGDIAEIVMMDEAVNDAQRIIIHNYLAAKYGLTLTSSDFYTMDNGANGDYDHDVAGIGQATGGDNHTDAQGTGVIRILSPTALDDGDFLLWGHNNGAMTATETVDIPSTTDMRLERVWRVSETADVGNIQMVWDLSALGVTDPTLVRLLVDTNDNNDFTDDTAISGATLLTDNSFMFSNVSALQDGYRFTIGLIQAAPGNITTNLEVWLKSDLGTEGDVTITGWEDQSVNANNANASGDPQYVSAAINYNPAIDFDGADDYLSTTGTALIGDNGTYTKYAVIISDNTSVGQVIIGSGSGSSHDIRQGSGARLRGQHGMNHWATSTGTVTQGQPHIVGARYGTGGSDNMTSLDGVQTVDNSAYTFTDAGTIEIATINSGTLPFDGYIAEAIVYNSEKTDTEVTQIESYLAVKYGITLDNSGGGTDGDYVASDGTTIWDADLNASYHNDVIAIGRDDNSALYQRQSRTQDDSLRIYIHNLASDNASNTGAIGSDVSYLVIGHNGGMLKSDGAIDTEVPSGIASRFVREWKITNTNFTEEFTLHFEWEELGTMNIADVRLLVDNDGNFSDASVYGPSDGLTFTEGSIIVSGINTSHVPADGTSYVTLASASEATTLPIELLSFEAEVVDEGRAVKLAWSTASETNNDFFTVERSQDSNEWNSILMVPGAGNSSSRLDYTALDERPLYGLSYYRLKQTDFDGAFSYSNTVFVTLGEFDDRLTIYPNPTHDRIHIQGAPEELRVIRIFDVQGREVTSEIRFSANSAGAVVIDVSRLPIGIYNILTASKSIRMLKSP